MIDRRRFRISAMSHARRRAVASIVGGVLMASSFSSPRLAAAAQPERIVAIGGAVTEILYALGQEERIAAVDATSLFPPEAQQQKPSVGYFRSLSAEGVLSRQPSLVIAIEGAGPPAALGTLREAGVRLELVPDAPTPSGVVAKITAIGRAVDASDAARRLAAQVAARFEELASLRARLPARRRVLFVLALQNGRALVGGRATAADAIIELAGGLNAAAAIEGYKPMSDEAVIAAAPDLIVMMRRDGASLADPFALPAFGATLAAKARALIDMDGLYLIGFGPRAPDAARDLMATLYPELNLPLLSASPGDSALGHVSGER